MNLFGNALKFTDSGYIELAVRSSANKEANAPVEIRITDTGIGMCKDFLFQGVFEPFRKHNEHSAGTGVGLNVVSMMHPAHMRHRLTCYYYRRSDGLSKILAVQLRLGVSQTKGPKLQCNCRSRVTTNHMTQIHLTTQSMPRLHS
jgi:K+-sensing histidine kinase KdpD